MKKIRYGILSTAHIVPRFVAGVRESLHGEVVAIASRSIAKAATLAKTLDIPTIYDSYNSLCEAEEVDVVYIPTYNQGHFEAAQLALSHHKHVLLEKPFTLKSEEAQALFDLAKQNQCFLMEAQKSLFLPPTQKAIELVSNGEIGDIRWLDAQISSPNIEHISWFHSLEAGGGALHGSANYPLHYMQHLLGKPITSYSGLASKKQHGVDTQSQLSLRFSSDILANIFITVEAAFPSYLKIAGTKGWIHIPNFWKTKEATIFYNNGKQETFTYDFNNEFVFEINHVNECLEKSYLTSPIMTPDLTIQTVKIVEDVYRQWDNKN